MPFRSEDDAQRARIESLEEELRVAYRERDRLRAREAELEVRAARADALEAKAARRGAVVPGLLVVAGGVTLVLLIAGLGLGAAYATFARREAAAEELARADEAAQREALAREERAAEEAASRAAREAEAAAPPDVYRYELVAPVLAREGRPPLRDGVRCVVQIDARGDGCAGTVWCGDRTIYRSSDEHPLICRRDPGRGFTAARSIEGADPSLEYEPRGVAIVRSSAEDWSVTIATAPVEEGP